MKINFRGVWKTIFLGSSQYLLDGGKFSVFPPVTQLLIYFIAQKATTGNKDLKIIHEQKCSVAQSRPTLQEPMDYRPPGSSVHGLFQARVLEWDDISYSRGSS